MLNLENGQIICGDCLVELQMLEANSVDAVVTDCPYGIKFMGRKWDYHIPSKHILNLSRHSRT